MLETQNICATACTIQTSVQYPLPCRVSMQPSKSPRTPPHNVRKGNRSLELLVSDATIGLFRSSNFPIALPSDCLQSLSQDRMRVVVAGEHPIRIHGAEILDLKLDERRREFSGIAKLVGEGICTHLLATLHHCTKFRRQTHQPQTPSSGSECSSRV